MNWNNPFTNKLRVSYPIVLAPMAGVAGGELAAAVSEAGGLGIVGGGYCDEKQTTLELRKVSERTAKPWGVGFITWKLCENPLLLDLALDYNPTVIFLSFGKFETFAEKIKKAGKILICQVQSVSEAKRAWDVGADVIVAQGNEAGGHGGNFMGTMSLVPAIVDAVSPAPVLAAGGITDGRGLAAALMLGASGVLMGTRFYAASESLGHPTAKNLISQMTGDKTIRTHVFDIVRGLKWPNSYNARVIQNQFTDHWHGNEIELSQAGTVVQKEYFSSVAIGDFSQSAIFAGEGIDLINSVRPAEEIITKTILQASSLVQSTSGMLMGT